MSFDPALHVFEYRFNADPKVKAETVIFVPRYQYPRGYRVKVRNARYAMPRNRSRLLIMDGRGDVTVRIDSRKRSDSYFGSVYTSKPIRVGHQKLL